jgi:hypothetical protein
MCKLTCCRNRLLLLFFLLFCCRRHHASFPNDVAAWTTWHNNQFGVEAALLAAPMTTMILIVTSSEGYRRLPGTKPYVFLRRTQPTTNPQCPSSHRDLNGQLWPPAMVPLPLALTHTTVAQNVGGLSYAVVPGVGRHGGRGTAATAKVGGARFS